MSAKVFILCHAIMGEVNLPYLKKTSPCHSFVTYVVSAHLHLKCPEPAVSANTTQLHGQKATPLTYTAVTFPAVTLLLGKYQIIPIIIRTKL